MGITTSITTIVIGRNRGAIIRARAAVIRSRRVAVTPNRRVAAIHSPRTVTEPTRGLRSPK